MTLEKSDHLFAMADEEARSRIVALGIGGMGRNAMENIAMTEIEGLKLYSVNTDMQDLGKCVGSQPVQIGGKRTGGKGAGGDFEVGRKSAEDDLETLRGLVEGADLVFIAAGMGGGTGTGAAPILAELCREMEILTIGIVTTPMKCEGSRRMEKAQLGLTELRKYVDSLMVIENEKLSLIMDRDDVSFIEIFRRADEVLLNGVSAISGMINAHGYINLDMADLHNVLKRPGKEDCAAAFIGVGASSAEDRAMRAAEIALDNPLLANEGIKGATNLLINIVADENMGLNEAQNAVKIIVEEAGDSEPEVYMGFATDNSMGDRISVTLIATGMGASKPGNQSIPVNAVTSKSCATTLQSMINEKAAAVSLTAEVADSQEIEAINQSQDVFPESIEEFGTTAFVKFKDWTIPAYARRECRHSEQVVDVTRKRKTRTDVRQEVSTLKRFKRKTRRTQRESLLRLAC